MSNFPESYCINLAHRSDRWESVQEEFKRIGVLDKVKRFGAISLSDNVDRQRGYVGCTVSHFAVLSQHVKGSIGVFEDDVRFINNTADILQKAFEQAPSDWDMIYLGANPTHQMDRHSENLLRVTQAFCTHAMIFNDTGIIKYILENLSLFERIDTFFMHHIQPKFKVFITDPIIATQANGHSDVTGVQNNYHDMIINNFNQFRPK